MTISYDNLAAIRGYALSYLPAIKNPDMESESNWTFTENAGYFRGHYTKFYRLEENATVYGWITDNATGEEIANARVSVNNHYGYKKSNMTDESGYYVIETIADRLWLESRADRYKRAVDELEIAGGQTLVVSMTNDLIMAFNMTIDEMTVINATIDTLPPGDLSEEVSRINGSVSDIVTGLPVANADVKVRNEYGFEKHTTTNGYGYFDVNTISGRSYIDVRADGYALNTTTVVMAGEHTINPKLSPENSIVNGFIYDNTTGASVSNAYIIVRSGGYYNSTRSNASGYYAIRSIAGHIEMEVSRRGYFPDVMNFNLSYGETRTVDMQIEPITAESSTISGYVCYNSTRLPGVKVVVSDHAKYEKTTLTDSDGYFEIETIPGHLWLDVLPDVYMDSSVEFELKSREIVTLDIELDASPNSRFQIEYPSETALIKGWYGGIYQDVESEAGLAALSFKVNDSYRTNRSEGCMYKQVLLNELIVWEDDVAEDEGWQAVRVPITLDNGTNRLMLRVYAKGDARSFPVIVCWDDVRIERFDRITDELGTSFYILDAEGIEEYYPTELYLGEPAEVLVVIENNEHEPVNYTMQVRLNGEVLRSEIIELEDGSKWAHRLSFTPDQTGVLLKLEFLLFKDFIAEEPYKAVHRWVSSYIAPGNLEVLEEYVVSPLPEIVNGDMESIAGWTYIENAVNFTGRLTNTTFVSPMHSYELSYPSKTPFEPGYYAGIFQHFTSETYPATVVLSFNVRDSYTPEREGYYVKQVLLNDEVIWEDDIGGDEKWLHVNVPVTLHSVTNKLTLRIYSARGSNNFPINVWWDDVTIEPVTAVGAEISTPFYILDTKGTEEDYPTELYLGEPAEVRVVIENNEQKQVNYILQMKLDGRLLKTRSKWLEHGSKWEQNISFTPDRVGENQKLEFLLFKDYVTEKPYRYCYLWVSTAINYYDLEPLLRYGIDPLPTIRDGDMSQVYAWTRESEHGGGFREGYHTEEYTSSPRSYCMKQYRESNKGDYMVLLQDIYALEPGVVVLSFNVRDSFEYASEDAKNILKQVMVNDEVIWADDVSGGDEGYVGWVKEEYIGPNWVWNERIKTHEGFLNWREAGHDWWDDDWIKRSVPAVETGWTHVDVPVYLSAGNNELRLRVYAKEAAENLNVKIYWDDVEIRPINELVKVDERVRMKRYRW
jgi:uncharacterized membrane protein